jgi:GDP-mannose 6-dehydrogenase
LYLGKRNDQELPLLQGIAASNSRHIEHAFALATAQGSRKIGMIGLSFKQGTDDLRESPLVALAEVLIGKGYDLRIFDPAVSLARLLGANKHYIEATIPHIESLLVGDLSEIGTHADVIVVGHRDAIIEASVAKWLESRKHVVDLAGLAGMQGRAGYSGVCW